MGNFNNDDIIIRTMGKNSNGLILICDNTNEDTLKEILELKNKYIIEIILSNTKDYFYPS